MRSSRRPARTGQRHRRCVRPQIPGLSPGGLGPQRTSSGFPRRAFLRFPVCPPGSSPSPAFLWFPLRPAFSGSVPSAVARFRFPFGFPPRSLPLSNLHGSAAARRFRRRWSQAAGTMVTRKSAPPLDRDPPAPQMGSGRARWDAATESPVTSGRERRTSPPPNRPDRRISHAGPDEPQSLSVTGTPGRRVPYRLCAGDDRA
jgi:hypothetical protein